MQLLIMAQSLENHSLLISTAHPSLMHTSCFSTVFPLILKLVETEMCYEQILFYFGQSQWLGVEILALYSASLVIHSFEYHYF